MSKVSPGTEQYQGPERRREPRRTGDDRREMVRYEPGKANRRSGWDRRKGNNVWMALRQL